MEFSQRARLRKLYSLMACLYLRWFQSEEKQDLEWVIAVHRLLLDSDLSGTILPRWKIFSGLAYSRFIRHILREEMADVDRAAELWRAALQHCPEPEARLDILVKLEEALRDRYEHHGRIEDVDEVIEINRIILNILEEKQSEQGRLPANFAVDSRVGLGESRISKDLSDMSRVCDGILGRPSSILILPHRSLYLHRLGAALWDRFNQVGNEEDSDEAIRMQRDALDLLPDSNPNRFPMLCTFGYYLQGQAKRSRDTEALGEAICSYRDALDLCPEGYPDKPELCSRLADVLSDRFEQSGSREDINESIELYRAALDYLSAADSLHGSEVQPEDPACRPLFRPAQTGAEGLEASKQVYREGRPVRALFLHALSATVLTRFEHYGAEEDLNESIRIQREVLTLFSVSDPCRLAALELLTLGLQFRFEQSGRIQDLDQAIHLLRDVLARQPNDFQARYYTLSHLGCALLRRFRQSDREEDLEESIRLARDAISLHRREEPYHHSFLLNLGNALRTRSERMGRKDHLNESIALNREVLALCPVGHPDRGLALVNLAGDLQFRGEPNDLDEAINILQESLLLLPRTHPYQCRSMTNMATVLYSRFMRDGCPGDVDRCIECLEQAVAQNFSNVRDRLLAADKWTRIARLHDHESTLTAYKTVINILLRVFTYRPDLPSCHDLLARNIRYRVYGVNAASYAIEKGDLRTAIEVLEQGRALLWSQMRGLRTSIDRLAGVSKMLANRFRAITGDLEALLTSSESRNAFGTVPRSVDGIMERMRQLSQEQEHLIDEIRNIPGFEHFLQAATFDELQRAAAEGPVIVINHSVFRCDALIVLSRDDVPCVCIPLDKEWFTEAAVIATKLRGTRTEQGPQSKAYDEVLREILRVLWDRVASKVVQKLGELEIPHGSRIWWCPTLILPSLPFHAAGPSQSDGGGKYCLDYYTSSYTPTLMSLITARAGVRSGSQKMLFVGDTKLPSTTKERYAIRKHLRIGKSLLDNNTSPHSVMKALGKAEWVHFACHGTLNYERPFESSLALPGGNLTLLDIAKTRLPNAEFAFLSACHTAELSPMSAHDEALHLAAAIQFCGFRSVVGTMWQLMDRDGPILAECVYMHLMNRAVEEGQPRFKGAASAVREAALFLRSQKDWTDDGREVDIATERWVNLVHIGA